MANWTKVHLGSLVDANVRWSFSGGPFGSNLKVSDYTEDGVRIIQLQNIGEGVFNDEYKIFTSESKADDLIANNIYPGEIIFSKMGDPVARACIVPCGAPRYVMASDGIRFKPDPKKADVYFLLNYVNCAAFRKAAESVSSGSTRMRIGLDELRMLEIPLPPLAEQRKIAEILRTWDEAIETAEAELKAKQERKRWLMNKLLTCPSELNGALHQNTWTTVGLGEVASFQNGEAFSSRYFNSEKRGLRLIRNRDLKNDDQIIFYDGEYSAKDVVNDGDLLVGMDGDFTPVIWNKGKALLNQRVGRITVKPETSKSYIYYTLYSVLTELEHVTSATTVKHLSSKGCLLLKISMPPFTSQCLISGILQSADADIQAINQRIEALRSQKRGLMQKLLTGKVRVAA